MCDDNELLRRYAAGHGEAEFNELVQRHLNLVYSAALRLVHGDTHRAEDVTQQVFGQLARQAKRLTAHPALIGWLYTTTRQIAFHVIRTEQRRQAREEAAHQMNDLLREDSPEPNWEQFGPVLDDAMHELEEKDRHAVLLRFFQNKSLKEVGAALGLGENAARMRVDRALDKLRAAFGRRGIAATGSLAAAISAHAVQTAPAHLVATLTGASLAGAGTGGLTLLKIMTATQIKLGIGAIVVAGATTAIVMQHHTQTQLREQADQLTQLVAQLQAEKLSLSNRLLAAGEPAPAATPSEELLRLRGEVGVLRQQKENLSKALASAQTTPEPRRDYPAPRGPGPAAAPLPEGYPKTPEAATQRIFEAWGRGDWDSFFTNYMEPGVPREFYDQTFNDQMKSNLAGLQVLSIGEPTNGFSAGHYFVPYKVQFQTGEIKELRLSIKQDPDSKRFYFDGGF